MKGERSEEHKVWVNFTLKGEPAQTYFELKQRGIIHSTRDVFMEGLRALQERVMERDLKMAQIRASRRLNEDGR